MNINSNGLRKTSSIKLPNLMNYLIIYLSVTVLLCFFGPIHFNIRNPGLVIFYLILYHAALWVGYKSANRNDIRKYKEFSIHEFSVRDKKWMHKLLLGSILVNIMLLGFTAGTFNPKGIIDKVISGILSPSDRYESAFVEAAERGSSIFSFIITLGMPFVIMALVLSVFYFFELSAGDKLLTIILYFTQICYCFILGANEGFFDIVIYIGVAVFLRLQYRAIKRKRGKMKKTWKILLLVIAVLLIYFALSFFTTNIIGRTGANFAFGTLGENYYDKDASINKYIPDDIYVTFVYLTAYLCEGYYGMSLATTLEWVPNFGMGFSSFIRNNLSDILGIDLFQNSYQVRIDNVYEWGALKNFHTAYTFWANDVGFIGVVFIMFILGYVFCKCYRASILRGSKSAIVMMPLLITMVLYLPANNKVFVQPASMLLMIYICVYKFLKYISKRKYSEEKYISRRKYSFQ
jgi:hypothetical protein